MSLKTSAILSIASFNFCIFLGFLHSSGRFNELKKMRELHQENIPTFVNIITNYYPMKYFVFSPFPYQIFILLVVFFSLPTAITLARPTITTVTYKIITIGKHTFGYDIYLEKKLLIHQPTIPALPGNNGFDSRPKAARVAQFMIRKIKEGEMPPTVTTKDLKKLRVIK